MSEIIIRIMGETDIADVTMQADATATSPLLDGYDEADRINLLGHWMDQGRGAALAEDAPHFAAMTIIASTFIAQQPLYKSLGSSANFMLLT